MTGCRGVAEVMAVVGATSMATARQRRIELMIQPIRAILFDFNGVVASRDVAGAVDAAHSVLHFFTVPPEAVLTRLLPAYPLSPAVDLGQATNVDRWEALRREVWRGPRHVWEEWWRAFDASYRMPDGMADLLRQLRGDYRLGLRTDNDAGFRARLEGWPDIATHFDVVVISAEEGIKKPSPHIFERAVGRLGSTYGTTAFLDDYVPNIVAAQTLGLRAIRVQSFAHMRADLHALLNQTAQGACACKGVGI